MRVTLELGDTEIRTAIAEYMQKRYPNANRFNLQFSRWRPQNKCWQEIHPILKVRWETQVS